MTYNCSGCESFWVGECDIPDGCEYDTAEELVEARIFDGKSMAQRSYREYNGHWLGRLAQVL